EGGEGGRGEGGERGGGVGEREERGETSNFKGGERRKRQRGRRDRERLGGEMRGKRSSKFSKESLCRKPSRESMREKCPRRGGIEKGGTRERFGGERAKRGKGVVEKRE
ncbi:hypothetical protein, partial [Campylobacter jejuni]|uniref:hypothetical protein n=1 Tax=Campylobacter jejuni TaxID=197 RepID=UPI001BFD720B